MKRTLLVAAAVMVAIGFATSVAVSQNEGPPEGPPAPPPPRAVPGLNAPDPHPNGCVDCHVDMRDVHLDVRISTLMAKWSEGVEPRLLSAARAAAPDSTKITGRHPKLSVTGADIPKSCLSCHGRNSTKAPPFFRLMHLVHLTSGDPNLYMSHFQGDCTPCHKLNQRTGEWSIPSAREPALD